MLGARRIFAKSSLVPEGDHEGRPYISSRTGTTCRGDPRGRPANSLLHVVPVLFEGDPRGRPANSLLHVVPVLFEGDPRGRPANSLHPSLAKISRAPLNEC